MRDSTPVHAFKSSTGKWRQVYRNFEVILGCTVSSTLACTTWDCLKRESDQMYWGLVPPATEYLYEKEWVPLVWREVEEIAENNVTGIESLSWGLVCDLTNRMAEGKQKERGGLIIQGCLICLAREWGVWSLFRWTRVISVVYLFCFFQWMSCQKRECRLGCRAGLCGF